MKKLLYFLVASLILDAAFTLIGCIIIDLPLKAVFLKIAVMSGILMGIVLIAWNLSLEGYKLIVFALAFTYIIDACMIFLLSSNDEGFLDVFIESHKFEIMAYSYIPTLLAQVLSYAILKVLKNNPQN